MSLRDAADTILQSQVKPDGSYDTLATVLRTDGDTVWVHIDGGAPETPCKKTVECRAGESVMVRISGGSAWITGNHTSPSTDDTEAEKAKEEARKAAGTATSFITDSDNGIFVHPKNSTQRGVRVTDVVDIVRDGKTVAEFGEAVQIGIADGTQCYLVEDYRSLKLKDREGNEYFYVSDLRNKDGSYTQNWIFELGDSITFYLELPTAANLIKSVTVNGEAVGYTTPSTPPFSNFSLSQAPDDGDIVEISYVPYYSAGASQLKAYTLGVRKQASKVGQGSFATGYDNVASEQDAFACGRNNTASAPRTFVSGNDCVADSGNAFAEGYEAKALGADSHAQNQGTVANCMAQTAIGTYNEIDGIPETPVHPSGAGDYGSYALIIGNGTYGNRSNALTVDWQGNLKCKNVGAPTTVSDFTVSKTRGKASCTVEAVRKSGNMIMLALSFTCDSAYNSTDVTNHSNLFVGTIPSKYKPAIPTSGVGYIQSQAVVADLSASAGQITVRPTATLAQGAKPWIYFSYFI